MSVYWRPYHDGWMMVAKLDGSGYTPSGIVAQQTARLQVDLAHAGKTSSLRIPMLGVVLAERATELEPGDVVVFEEGTLEIVTDCEGEQFGLLPQEAVLDVLDGYGQSALE